MIKVLMLFCGVLLGGIVPLVEAATLRVGPAERIRSVAQAARLARDGDTVEITAGTYVGDVAVWSQKRLTIRGVGGRPRLLAGGRSAEGKGIWVIRGDEVTVDNITFEGARVPARNGAGIRHEAGFLWIRNCRFRDNETGILTGNELSLSLRVEDSEFSHGVDASPRISHLLYAGRIGRLEVRGSTFHHAVVGHLIKSRAQLSIVEYNSLFDGEGGRGSYELEFPEGGVAVVLGNLIGQSPGTENPRMLAYGAEGLIYPDNRLYVASNTFVDNLPSGGEFIALWSPEKVKLQVVNNLFVGGCAQRACPEGLVSHGRRGVFQEERSGGRGDREEEGNVLVPEGAARVVLADQHYRPSMAHRWPAKPLPEPAEGEPDLVPRRQYRAPVGSRSLGRRSELRAAGAFQP
ncbi:right-handed parallel beta-helix repeat-containing protein [Zoogloea sp.]|uniref:right-handed parallel beta-helix repeat-containing protein n=1 Tax=Zoogloea sp. TaxID=49181 RepID=UPI00260B125C|nr:right-handed parallel beta-helix repeat-containing protein [Zoogloea sp.]MDD3354807.1 right-handed parallel beta-helix repeat-containing protein [Zoogloea sp.]